MLSIIGLAAIVMLVRQPHLVFDTGAWLSFLSVIALAHSVRPHEKLAERDRRPVALTWSDDVGDGLIRVRSWLLARYYPMLWILAATVPLTMEAFHVVSPVSLLVNVLLIPVTAVALWLGFATIVVGWLVPWGWNLPAMAFSGVLEGLMRTVDAATKLGIGHTWLADVPSWFLPVSYSLLLLTVLLRRRVFRRFAWLGIVVVASIILLDAQRVASRSTLRCTVLDVGHGSAAIVEFPAGQVMLVDAGAMNRGTRVGETISRCLWKYGHRMINTILVSHADVDHFNGLDTLFSRFRVGQLLLSHQFVRNESPLVEKLVRIASRHQCPVRLVTDGELGVSGTVRLEVVQASPETMANAESDNEKSLVVQLHRAGTTICLPGDLEGRAMDDVLSRLAPSEVLVSPHHGSLKANVTAVATHLRPTAVIVSARDARHRTKLQAVYEKSKLLFTSDSGAITIDVASSGSWSIDQYRDP